MVHGEVGSPQRTRRAGEPSTGAGGDGGTQPSQATWAGQAGPSPQGNPRGAGLSQTSGSAEASLTEEPGAGILARRDLWGRRVTGVPTATVPGQSGT